MANRFNDSNLKQPPTVLMNIDDLRSAFVDGAFVRVVRQSDLTAFNPLATIPRSPSRTSQGAVNERQDLELRHQHP